MDNIKTVQRRLSQAAATIDKQVPSLAYFGFALWLTWNTIAFSGSIWLHDPSNLLRAEDLMMCHLGSSVVTLCVFAVLSRRVAALVAKAWFAWLGAAVACLGTFLIVITREAVLPSQTLFLLGGMLSGPGTTVLFTVAVAYFGVLPPRRSFLMLVLCSLFASFVYFVLSGIPNELASACFIILPLASALLLSLRPRASVAQSLKDHDDGGISPRLGAFLLFLALCSVSVELARGIVLIGIPPAMSFSSRLLSQFCDIILMSAMATFILLRQDQYNCAKLYSIATTGLLLLLLAVACFGFQSICSASTATTLCTCFNLTAWGVFAYIVFQASSSPFRVFLLGNAALSVGTLGGVFMTLLYYDSSWINPEAMNWVFLGFAAILLAGLPFFMSEKNIGKLLPPIEKPRLEEDVIGGAEKRPKRWVLACEAIAEQYGLSEREREVFVALARGKSAQEIADKEFVSIYTVRAHTRSIYAKLDVHSKKELVDFVERHGG